MQISAEAAEKGQNSIKKIIINKKKKKKRKKKLGWRGRHLRRIRERDKSGKRKI